MSIHERLEYLRGELRAERISYGELAELQGLAEHIEPGDVELLEAAGVPEHSDDDTPTDDDKRAVREAIRHIRDRDCDFLTAETVGMYAHVSEDVARAVMLADGFDPRLVA